MAGRAEKGLRNVKWGARTKQGPTSWDCVLIAGLPDLPPLALPSISLPPSPHSSRQAPSLHATMQTAVQHFPLHLAPPYSRQSISSAVNMNSNGLPTPPIATRKRKRAHQYTVSYSEVHEVDSEGRLREVIVIDDTPPPPTASPATTTHTNGYSASYQPPTYTAPIRTRARAAAEALALSASTSSAVISAPAVKKRRRDNGEDAGTITRKPAPLAAHAVPNNTSWAPATGADVCSVQWVWSDELC